jgi:glutathione peroxidase
VFSLPQSPYPPLAVGFFGLGTGYLIYGPRELVGYPKRDERVDFATGMWGIWMPGFPANDFAGQEPGSNEEIAEFCTGTYGVQSPMFSKIAVTGAGKHPLYAELTSAVPHARGDKEAFRGNLRGYGMTPTEDPEVLWNFEKFLVSARGEVVDRFAPHITPDDEQITAAIEHELQAG